MTISRRTCLLALIGSIAAGASACSPAQTTGQPGTPVAGTGSAPATSPGAPSSGSPAATSAPPSASPSPTPTAPQTPTPGASDPLPAGPVNVLFIGTDSRTPGANTGNSDVIVVAQLSADRERLALVSIARDSYVRHRGGGRGKINGSYARGGAKRLRQTIEDLLDIRIQFTAQTDFTDFRAITRLLEPLTVQNRHGSTVGSVRFPKGRLSVGNDENWLHYVRQRYGLPLGDLDRAERHRAMLTGMLARLVTVSSDAAAFATLAGRVWGKIRVTGDIKASQLAALAPVVAKLDASAVTSLMVPVDRFDIIRGAWVDILDPAQTRALSQALQRGDVRPYVKKYGTAYAP